MAFRLTFLIIFCGHFPICLQRVTPWNNNKLRQAIINGSEIHPGATHYVDKLSTLLLRPDRRARMAVARKLQSSRGVVTQPSKSCDYEFEGKSVYRHVQDGDIVLVNRQVLDILVSFFIFICYGMPFILVT